MRKISGTDTRETSFVALWGLGGSNEVSLDPRKAPPSIPQSPSLELDAIVLQCSRHGELICEFDVRIITGQILVAVAHPQIHHLQDANQDARRARKREIPIGYYFHRREAVVSINWKRRSRGNHIGNVIYMRTSVESKVLD